MYYTIITRYLKSIQNDEPVLANQYVVDDDGQRYGSDPDGITVFAKLCVGGVRLAIYQRHNVCNDACPVLYLCPSDDPYFFVVADDFVDFVQRITGKRIEELSRMIDANDSTCIRSAFNQPELFHNLLDESTLVPLTKKYFPSFQGTA